MTGTSAAVNNDISSLVKRLELATSRLEDILEKKGNTANVSLSVTAAGASSTSKTATAATSNTSLSSPFVVAFEELLGSSLEAFMTCSANVKQDLIKSQANHVKAVFQAQFQIIKLASQFKKPSSADKLQALLKPIVEAVTEASKVADSNRSSPFFNHLAFVKEGLQVASWVVVEPKPCPFITEMRDAGQFYGNRVLKDYKDKEKSHVDWINSFVALLNDLNAYVKKYHTTGLVWNAKAESEASLDSTAGAVGAATSAPAPPPPPPAGFFDDLSSNNTSTPKGSDKPSMNSVFSELNKGDKITAGLKKVEKSQMTHKNPELRASGVVKESSSPVKPVSTNTGAKAVAPKKPPVKELDGNKWSIENYMQAKDPIILNEADLEPKNVVNIFNCQHVTIEVKGKVNAISLVKCKRVGIVVQSVVSTIEAVDCQAMQVQVLDKAPTISVDKTDGCIIYLGKASLDTEILTAKSSEVNVCIPSASDKGEFVEKPVPEQFKTIIRGGNSIITTPVEHSGG